MGVKITGANTPFGEASWEFTEADKPGIQELFFFLEAEGPLANPIEVEIRSWYEQSAIEMKSRLTQLLSQYSFNTETIRTM